MPNTEAIFPERTGPRREWRSAALTGIVGIAALLAVGGAALVFSREGAAAKTTRVPGGMNSALVFETTLRDIISVSGTLELEKKEMIVSPRAGLVKELYVEEGQSVAAGTLILRLDSKDLERELEDKRLSLAKLKSQAERAEVSFSFGQRQSSLTIGQSERSLADARAEAERMKALAQRGVASNLEVAVAERKLKDAEDAVLKARISAEEDEALRKVDARGAEADRGILEASAADLEAEIAACTIRSASGGTVYALAAEAGGTVKLYDQLAVIADPRDVRAALDVPESQAAKLRKGLPVSIFAGATSYPATVERVSPSASSSSASAGAVIRVIAGFEEKPAGAIVGASVSAEIVAGVLEGALALPRGPWMSSGNYATAYAIDPAAASPRAIKKAVKLGVVDGQNIQIISGLSEGEEIIVSDYRDFIHLDEVPLDGDGGKNAQP